MPGFVVDTGSIVMCAHGGRAQPTVPNPRVLIGGMPSVTISAPYVVAGCTFSPGGPSPCVTAQWMTGSTRVTSNGQPLVLVDSQAVCVPNGTPVMIPMTQVRVVAQ
jgi:hypothetical protein